MLAKVGAAIKILVPILAALAGAYATHRFTLSRASEETANETKTLLGIAKGAIDLAQSTKASPELIRQLEQLSSQAKAVQANLNITSNQGGISLQADFWLRVGQSAKLLNAGTIGLNTVYGPADILVSFNDGAVRLPNGRKAPYKTKSNAECVVVYMGPSPDNTLYGFKNWCE